MNLQRVQREPPYSSQITLLVRLKRTNEGALSDYARGQGLHVRVQR